LPNGAETVTDHLIDHLKVYNIYFCVENRPMGFPGFLGEGSLFGGLLKSDWVNLFVINIILSKVNANSILRSKLL